MTNAELNGLPESEPMVWYYPQLHAICGGSVKAVLFLSRMILLARQAPDAAGWLCRTQQELFAETGLTEKAQVTARKKLKAAGLLEEKLAERPARLRYRLNWTSLAPLLRWPHPGRDTDR